MDYSSVDLADEMCAVWRHDIEITEEKYEEISSQIKEFLIPVDKALPPDGYWCLWCSKTGKKQIARFKNDAMNHFYPKAEFELEECVSWMPLP